MCVAAIMCLYIAGCGYKTSMLRGEKIRYMHVAVFLNRSYESGLDRLLTDAVTDEFIFRGAVKITDVEKADVELTGVIKEYVLKPLSYNRKNEAEQYRLRISADILLKERSTEKIIWEAKDLSGEWTFLRLGPLTSSEEKARDKAIKYLAREIVQNAVEMW